MGVEEHVVITTKLGQLKGHTLRSAVFDKPFYAFQGIPYAKPPTGKLRFKAPQPFGGWEGVRDALEDGNSTLQPILIPIPGVDPDKIDGDEDCLFLNVYINELPKKSGPKKPVMFSIHGGGFFGGNGGFSFSGPDYLLNEDVIVVAINYRCGALGFLSLEMDEAPGNAGLKDQVLALKWVKDNIDSFGGDPNNVTIFGVSAGGASVDFLLLSPLSKGLFHKAIIQSGFSTNSWALQTNPRERAAELARYLGCESDNADEILKYLQSVPGADIVTATKKITESKAYIETTGMMFVPSVEVSGAEPFLPDTPGNLYKSEAFNKVPVVLGCCGNEGIVVALGFVLGTINDQKEFDIVDKNRELLVPGFLNLKPGSAEIKEAGDAILKFYTKGKPFSWDTFNDYITFQSDVMFCIGMERTRLNLLEKSTSPVFSYLFTNHSKLCFCSSWKYTAEQAKNENVKKIDTTDTCHGADGGFIYCMRGFLNMLPEQKEVSLTDKEHIVKHIKAWTTFASTGDPNVKELGVSWEKDSKDNPNYMDIGTSWTMKNGIPFAERIDFWKKLCLKYDIEF